MHLRKEGAWLTDTNKPDPSCPWGKKAAFRREDHTVGVGKFAEVWRDWVSLLCFVNQGLIETSDEMSEKYQVT